MNITQMSDDELARYLHGHLVRSVARWLASAIHWRDHAKGCRAAGARKQARRYMRQSALAWRREWAKL